MGYICWFKTDECVGRCFSEFELIFTSFQRASRIFELKPFQRNGSRIHPTQKPQELYKFLLKNYCKQGDKIFDSHLGSMSIAIATHDLGFHLTGAELDADYFRDGIQRVKNHVAQKQLF
jgi:site-specific DNA-methyltransferase (adenine-specific)